MKSKKANMVAITMLVVLILAGGAIVASVKFQDNRMAERTNVQEHELELEEMIRAGYDDANFNMNGIYYNHPTPTDGEVCLWYRNRPTPANTEQFLEQLQVEIRNNVQSNFGVYSADMPVQISVGNIEIRYNPGYELPEDIFELELYDLIINSDEGVYPIFTQDKSGTYNIETKVGNIYNAIIAWMKTDAGNVMPKIQEKFNTAQCYYHICPCEHTTMEGPDGFIQKAFDFQAEEHEVMLQKIKDSLSEAVNEIEMEGYTCTFSSNIDIQDTVRKHYSYGACPKYTPSQLQKTQTSYELAAGTYEMTEDGCETPLNIMSEEITDGSVTEKQIPELSEIVLGDIEDEPPQDYRTIYYDLGFDTALNIDWEITCSNVVEGTYIIIPLKLDLFAVCDMPQLPPSGTELCGHDGNAAGGCILEDFCRISENCKPMYCEIVDGEETCVERDQTPTADEWARDPDRICMMNGIDETLCGKFTCDWNDGNPSCGTWISDETPCTKTVETRPCTSARCIGTGGPDDVCDDYADDTLPCSRGICEACECVSGMPRYSGECRKDTKCTGIKVDGMCNAAGVCSSSDPLLNKNYCCMGYLCSIKAGSQYSGCVNSDNIDVGNCCEGFGLGDCAGEVH